MSTLKNTLLVICTLLLVGGCSAHQPVTEKDIHFQNSLPAKPTYIAGEFFTYDNGKTKLVAQENENLITWKVGKQSIVISKSDFTLPPISWSNPHSESNIVTTTQESGLWPLKLGASVRFSSKQIVTEKTTGVPREVLRNWHCTVKSTETIQVPVGEFNTFKITCSRYSGKDRGWRGTIDYYYSPDIGHNVRIKSKSSSSFKTQDLSDYGFNSNYLPKSDSQKLKKVFNKMLDSTTDGVAEVWVDSSRKISLLLVPLRSYLNTKAQSCREYRSIYSIEGRVKEHSREYCKNQQGDWYRVN